ncbi:MAG: hypothetical protein AAF702_02285 [Chloroflexota bacterium]
MKLPSVISTPFFAQMFRGFRRWRTKKTTILTRRPKAIDEAAQRAFDALLQAGLAQGVDEFIDYDLTYPKIDFLNYLCDQQGYVVHGSKLSDLRELKPIRHTTDKTEFGNRQMLFASPDPAWGMWFAILDKTVAKATSNACIRQGASSDEWTKYYFFELPTMLKETDQWPFVDGTIYLARAEDFPEIRSNGLFDLLDISVEEWGCMKPVQPLAKLSVSPTDFPFLEQVDYVIDLAKFSKE